MSIYIVQSIYAWTNYKQLKDMIYLHINICMKSNLYDFLSEIIQFVTGWILTYQIMRYVNRIMLRWINLCIF